MLGDLDSSQVDALLRSELVGRLGCHANGRTYVVPVTYVYDGRDIYGHSGAGLKIELMRANPEVCFEVDHMEDMANWQSVIASGTYEELQGDEAVRAMRMLMERLEPLVSSETSQPRQVPESIQASGDAKPDTVTRFHAGMTNGHPVMYCIRLHTKTGRFEKR